MRRGEGSAEIRTIESTVNAFVHARIDQLVHVSFPPGLKDQGNVLQLLRALYGLRSSLLL